MPNLLIDKSNISNIPNPGSQSIILGFDIDGILKKKDSTGTITSVGSQELVSVNTTRAQVLNAISNSTLTPGCVYTFDADLSGYNYDENIEVSIPAVSSNLLSNVGWGKFYNPIYQLYTEDVNFGIWDSSSTYSIGATAIWGGYYWNNITGNTGTASDVLTLQSDDWSKVNYGTSYNVVLDEIEYDINLDFVFLRKDIQNNIIIKSSTTNFDVDGVTYDKHPMRFFQWGRTGQSDATIPYYGISFFNDVKITNDSIWVNINDKWGAYTRVKVTDSSAIGPTNIKFWSALLLTNVDKASYIYGLTLSYAWFDSINLKNDAYITNSQFLTASAYHINLQGSYQNNILVIGKTVSIYGWTVTTNSQQYLDFVESYQENLQMIGTYQSHLDFSNESYQLNINLIDYGFGDTGGQSKLVLENGSYQTNIDIYGSSNQTSINLTNGSFQSGLILSNTSTQTKISLENSSRITNTVIDSSLLSNIKMVNESSIINTNINNNSEITKFYLDNESSISNLYATNSNLSQFDLFNSSTIITFTSSTSTFNQFTLTNGSLITNMFFDNCSPIEDFELNNGTIENWKLDHTFAYDIEVVRGGKFTNIFATNSEIGGAIVIRDYSVGTTFSLNNSSWFHTTTLSGASNLSFVTLNNSSELSQIFLRKFDINSSINLDNETKGYHSISSYTDLIQNFNLAVTQDNIISSTYEIFADTSNYFKLSAFTNSTISFTAAPTNLDPSQKAAVELTIKLTNNGYSVGFTNNGGNILWSSGTPPILSSGTDVLSFTSDDFGTNWYGYLIVTNLT